MASFPAIVADTLGVLGVGCIDHGMRPIDDPTYFGSYMDANYRVIRDAFDPSRADLAGRAKTSFAVWWLNEGAKAERIDEVATYAAT